MVRFHASVLENSTHNKEINMQIGDPHTQSCNHNHCTYFICA